MGNRKIILGIGALAIVAGGALIIVMNDPNISSPATPPDNGQAISPTSITPLVAAPSGFTMSEVAGHNSPQSCWTAVSGNVYDLTSWIKAHPGGAKAILALCGTDGTDEFIKQHAGQKRPEAQIIKLLIGELR